MNRRYPLRFTYHDVITGNGFVANVIADGRLVLSWEDEDQKWWVWGVSPGAFAASGETQNDALAAFRTSWRSVLIDSAFASSSYGAFASEVEGYFHETSAEAERDWWNAVEAVRGGALGDLAEIPQRSADEAPKIEVANLDERPGATGPELNVVHDAEYSKAA